MKEPLELQGTASCCTFSAITKEEADDCIKQIASLNLKSVGMCISKYSAYYRYFKSKALVNRLKNIVGVP